MTSAALSAALQLLQETGYRVCSDETVDLVESKDVENMLSVPSCKDFWSETVTGLPSRLLLEEESHAAVAPWWINLVGSLGCVTLAALAAGLTLGLLALDPLLLLIKQRAGATPEERHHAGKLLPIVKQHHRLLVTLLLMNSVANEALPIFLDALVPASIAILMSVTLVLFFGEIIPSAIFTGPKQLAIACALLPVVRFFMAILYPLAGPIGSLLDYCLGHDDDGTLNRLELSALIRIHYEERLAKKNERKTVAHSASIRHVEGERVGALDFTDTTTLGKKSFQRKSIQAAKNQLLSSSSSLAEQQLQDPPIIGRERSDSIQLDEVTMAQGALQMKTKVALDVFTPKRHVFTISSDFVLSERNQVQIYASGYTRVPVHAPGDDSSAIVGILMTKQLIVIDAHSERTVSTVPLRRPLCVAPSVPLVDLLNMLQTGGSAVAGGGHLALVCARPAVGNEALAAGRPVPEEAEYMGIVTLEDVLEALLQEQIYDEMDKKEREYRRLAQMVCRQWKRYVKRKKAGLLVPPTEGPSMAPVVEQVVRISEQLERGDLLQNERTKLLSKTT